MDLRSSTALYIARTALHCPRYLVHRGVHLESGWRGVSQPSGVTQRSGAPRDEAHFRRLHTRPAPRLIRVTLSARARHGHPALISLITGPSPHITITLGQDQKNERILWAEADHKISIWTPMPGSPGLLFKTESFRYYINRNINVYE